MTSSNAASSSSALNLNDSSGLTDLIAVAWQHRYNSRIPETRDCLQDIERYIEKLAQQERASAVSPLALSEIELLRVSLHRHDNEMPDAHKGLVRAAELVKQAGRSGSFQYFMQVSLCHNTESKLAKAFHAGQESAKWATNDFELLIAKYNIAIYQFNLNLPTRQTLVEIDELLRKNPEHPLKSQFERIRVMDLKRSFYAGSFHDVLSLPCHGLGQVRYLQALLLSLPWQLTSADDARSEFITRASSPEDFFRKSYRVQTLAADPRLQTTEDHGATLQLRVDRLYLWTWLWLSQPESAVRQLLAQEIADFPFEDAHLSLTSDDFLMLESLGGWLSLFNSSFERDFGSWLRKYRSHDLPQAPFFDLDRQCREAFRAGVRTLNLLEELEKIWKNKSQDLHGYFACIKEIARSRSLEAPKAEATILVRRDDFSLVIGKKRIISQPGCELLAALKTDGSISFEAALQTAFHIPEYDELVHAPKIYNLIQRLKSALPESVRLWTKNQRIYLEDEMSIIHVFSGSAHQRLFPEFEFPRDLLEKKQSVQREKRQNLDFQAQLLLAFKDQKRLSRQEIQDHLNVSKATTNRLISHWLKAGVLQKSGKGRLCDYQLRTP